MCYVAHKIHIYTYVIYEIDIWRMFVLCNLKHGHKLMFVYFHRI